MIMQLKHAAKIRLAFTIIALSAVVGGQPQYRVRLQEPLRYKYMSGHTNQLFDGSCCNSDETSPCTLSCSGVTVELCFREKGHDLGDRDGSNCPLGGMVFTPLPPNRGFRAAGSVELQPTSAATTTMYQGEFQVLYKIRSAQPDSLIDEGTRTLSPPASTDRDKPDYRAALVTGIHGITRLVIDSLAIVCADGYLGSNCNVRECIPRDDSGGHFDCDSNQNKICLPGYEDPGSHCVKPVGPPTATTGAATQSPRTTIQTSTVMDNGGPVFPTGDTELFTAEVATTLVPATSPRSTGTPVVTGGGGQVLLVPFGTESPPKVVGVEVIGGAIAGAVLLLLLGSLVLTAVCLKYKTKKPVPTMTADGTTVNSNEEFTIESNPLYNVSRASPSQATTTGTQVAIPVPEDADSYYETIDNYL